MPTREDPFFEPVIAACPLSEENWPRAKSSWYDRPAVALQRKDESAGCGVNSKCVHQKKRATHFVDPAMHSLPGYSRHSRLLRRLPSRKPPPLTASGTQNSWKVRAHLEPVTVPSDCRDPGRLRDDGGTDLVTESSHGRPGRAASSRQRA